MPTPQEKVLALGAVPGLTIFVALLVESAFRALEAMGAIGP